MTQTRPNPLPLRTTPLPDIEKLVALHGTWAVIRALALALWRPEPALPAPPDPRHLSNHLRRDIGLPPKDAPRHIWHLRP